MPDLTPLEAAETLELHAPWVGGTYRDAMLKAAAAERKIAAGEYKQVVHAHWVDYCVRDWHCSACKAELTGHYDGHCENDLPKYCPSCGALMNGKEDTE